MELINVFFDVKSKARTHRTTSSRMEKVGRLGNTGAWQTAISSIFWNNQSFLAERCLTVLIIVIRSVKRPLARRSGYSPADATRIPRWLTRWTKMQIPLANLTRLLGLGGCASQRRSRMERGRGARMMMGMLVWMTMFQSWILTVRLWINVLNKMIIIIFEIRILMIVLLVRN